MPYETCPFLGETINNLSRVLDLYERTANNYNLTQIHEGLHSVALLLVNEMTVERVTSETPEEIKD